jgi:hypothetical protein
MEPPLSRYGQSGQKSTIPWTTPIRSIAPNWTGRSARNRILRWYGWHVAMENHQVMALVRAMQAENEAIHGIGLALAVWPVRPAGIGCRELGDGNVKACAPALDAELYEADGQLQRDESPGEPAATETVERNRQTNPACCILEGLVPGRRPKPGARNQLPRRPDIDKPHGGAGPR